MTILHAVFLDHFELQGYAEKTIKTISSLSHYLPVIIIEYLPHLHTTKKLPIGTYNIYFYSIKYFCEHIMPGKNMIDDL